MAGALNHQLQRLWQRSGLVCALWVALCFGSSETALGLEVIMAIDHYPPYHIVPTGGGEPYGETISIVNAVVERVNRQGGFDISLRYTPDTPFKRCLQMMKKGEADIMGGLFNKADRETYMEMLEYKGRSNKIFVLLNTSRVSIATYDDLKNLVIGTQLGFLYFDRFDADSTLKKAPVLRIKQNMHKLLAGRIDTFILSEIQFKGIQDQYPKLASQLKTADYVYDKLNPVCIGISRQSILSDPIYLDIFRNVVSDMLANGEFLRILEEFYRGYYSTNP